jgi:hypothetical protein
VRSQRTLGLGRRDSSASAPSRHTKPAILFFGLIATVIPFALGVASILNHFYRQGAYLLDSGLLAYLMTQPDPSLPLPRSLGGGSFYAIHVVPIFSILGQLARLVPLTPPQFFAAFIGLCQALLAGGVFWALVGPIGLRRVSGIAFAALLAIAFANSGLAIAILRYPHFEILIVAAAILLLVALHEGRIALAVLFLALALVTREDAGFHVALLLAAILATQRRMGVVTKTDRPMLVLLALAFLYSAIAFAAQHWAFPDRSSFTRIYVGDPTFAHVTPSLIVERLVGWATFRTYAILPGAVALSWAILRRNPLLAAGYVSTAPWLLIHLLAVSELAGTLSSYYAFPLLIASFWPVLGVLRGSRIAGPLKQLEAVLGFGLMIAASFTALSVQQNPNGVGLADMFAPPPSLASARAVAEAVTTLAEAQQELGPLFVDGGIASLAPDAFAGSAVFWTGAKFTPDTIVYFSSGFKADAARQHAARAGLSVQYRIRGTPIRVATDRDLDQIPDLAPLLQRIPQGDTSNR